MNQCKVPPCTRPVRATGYCTTHYSQIRKHGRIVSEVPVRRRPLTAERFWTEVDRGGGDDRCWLWMGALGRGGYGVSALPLRARKKYGAGGDVGAHRAAWFWTYGSLPPRHLQLDHLCRERRCVNPQHLEPVTAQVNNRRGFAPSRFLGERSACNNGHEFTPANTAVRSDGGGRLCRTCDRERDRVRPARPRPPTLATHQRQWAIENGLHITDRGRIPRRIVEAYERSERGVES